MFDLFQFEFMQRAFLAGIVMAIAAPLMGSFLVVRRYSTMSDTLAHVSLVGVAIGLLTRTYPPLMAIVASVVTVTGIEFLRARWKLMGESLLALFLSGSLALAVVLLRFAKGFNTNFLSYLFGSITTVSPQDILLIGSLGLLVILITLMFFKEFYAIAFDEEVARASGLPVSTLNLVQMILAAILVSLSISVVGVLLIGALMVIPVLTAQRVAGSFKKTVLFAALFSLCSVISGLYASYFLDLPSGGAIVLVSLSFFIGVSVLAPGRV